MPRIALIASVHGFRPLNVTEIAQTREEGWTPPGVTLVERDSEAVTSVIRIAGGNFGLFEKLLTEI
jgi:hypothetical protein